MIIMSAFERSMGAPMMLLNAAIASVAPSAELEVAEARRLAVVAGDLFAVVGHDVPAARRVPRRAAARRRTADQRVLAGHAVAPEVLRRVVGTRHRLVLLDVAEARHVEDGGRRVARGRR